MPLFSTLKLITQLRLRMTIIPPAITALTLSLFASALPVNAQQEKIDRYELVNRNNVVLHQADTLGSLSVGNGEFAFTVDASGLQTFPDDYEHGVSLGTFSQWAWHGYPHASKHSLSDVDVLYTSCDSTQAPYPIQHSSGSKKVAADALRSNPQRLHLGLIGLNLKLSNGEAVKLSDLKAIRQTLNLWTGELKSYYEIEGTPVTVTLFAHQQKDEIGVNIQSTLITRKRLSITLRFPNGKECHTCAGYDFESPEKHNSTLTISKGGAIITRTLDTTRYVVGVRFSKAIIKEKTKHQFEIIPASENFSLSVVFARTAQAATGYDAVARNSILSWKDFWMNGGAIDFSQCTDPRAKELERRVLLSQYVTKIQCSGSLPPQETGLTMNSWFGKFHMEMYWWHSAHFPLWGRKELLEKSMGWYDRVHEQAKRTAIKQGYRGARWQKMTDPFGHESPSSVGAFIIWQQPHPIYLAELLYRSKPTADVLERYRPIVLSTAEFMKSFVKKQGGVYHLCHPLIPAQEIFPAKSTDDPAYELQYWHYALSLTSTWRSRLGMPKDDELEDVVANLTPLPVRDGLYLPNATTPSAYADEKFRHDHPAVLGAYGFLPWTSRMDSTIMLATLKEIIRSWDWPSTWGWDYPLVAMTATRLHQPDLAIDALLMPVQKNSYLVNGHNFQDNRLRLYLPGNGGLLAAVALMAAGWDGNNVKNPGFPKNGKWNVRWEGLQPMP
jgi:protein-glucosylgalactosylhydroxylysine glucosidase